eukprot:Anaeramoba_flamelloidesa86313_29.p2 GENE.a86313_29~~a86313_29.p2  ORF type:complete len:219 (-),score=32.95 a86313_29:32-688(-)
MKHRVGFNKLSRKSSHRKAMTRNMVTSLFRYERITTTKAKALEIRKTAEKMITRAKVDSVHNRRIINKDLKDGEILNKLFTEIGPAYINRPGGYTRILKTGLRKGDAAEMVILELVIDEESDKKKKSAKPKKKAEPAKKVEEKPVEEVKAEEVKAEESKEEVAEEPVEKEAVEATTEAPVEEAPVEETETSVEKENGDAAAEEEKAKKADVKEDSEKK